MIRVFTDGQPAGILDRRDARGLGASGKRGSTFAYDPLADANRAVSLTMPVRVQSWDSPHDLLPIFQMHVPEGALRSALVRRFAKAAGTFDDIDLLSVVGRTQLGRIRYAGLGETLDEAVPFQSVDALLKARRDGGLMEHLLDTFARHSGLSGVQPKVLIRDEGKLSAGKARRSSSIRSATHIVKLWDCDEFPELAANEHACLTAARLLGLEVPPFELSEDGDALVVERFDIDGDACLGFEDFCVLNGLGTADKYAGGYERQLFRRAAEFLGTGPDAERAMRDLYRLFVLCCAIRNGDAHLKNFGLIYRSLDGPVTLAPVYDLVTTTAYLPADMMALTLEGSTRWPDAARLTRLGRTRFGLSTPDIAGILEATADALSDAWAASKPYFDACPSPEIGPAIAAAWQDGIRGSLGLAAR